MYKTFQADDFTDYIIIKEALEKRAVSTRAIIYHVVARCIDGIIKKGNLWFVPFCALMPEDRRRKQIAANDKAERRISGGSKYTMI